MNKNEISKVLLDMRDATLDAISRVEPPDAEVSSRGPGQVDVGRGDRREDRRIGVELGMGDATLLIYTAEAPGVFNATHGHTGSDFDPETIRVTVKRYSAKRNREISTAIRKGKDGWNYAILAKRFVDAYNQAVQEGKESVEQRKQQREKAANFNATVQRIESQFAHRGFNYMLPGYLEFHPSEYPDKLLLTYQLHSAGHPLSVLAALSAVMTLRTGIDLQVRDNTRAGASHCFLCADMTEEQAVLVTHILIEMLGDRAKLAETRTA